MSHSAIPEGIAFNPLAVVGRQKKNRQQIPFGFCLPAYAQAGGPRATPPFIRLVHYIKSELYQLLCVCQTRIKSSASHGPVYHPQVRLVANRPAAPDLLRQRIHASRSRGGLHIQRPIEYENDHSLTGDSADVRMQARHLHPRNVPDERL